MFTFCYFVGFRIVAKGWSPSQMTRWKGYEGRDVDRQEVMTRGRSATEKSSRGSLGMVRSAVCGRRQRGWRAASERFLREEEEHSSGPVGCRLTQMGKERWGTR